MEQLKTEGNETINLRFVERSEVYIRSDDWLKENFRPRRRDKSPKLTNEEINKINKIIRLGNKITKGYEDEKNNSGDKYNEKAKIIFEPGKDYEITKTEFEELRKVFWLKTDCLVMNKKIEFEFKKCQKIKMREQENSSQHSAIEKLLGYNSIEIEKDKDKEEAIVFEDGKKYYFTVDEIKLLNEEFDIDKNGLSLTKDCICKNIFDIPLEILISTKVLHGNGNLNYYKYIDEKSGISGCLLSQLTEIKRKYKKARSAIEKVKATKENEIIDENETVNEIKEIIKNCDFNKMESNEIEFALGKLVKALKVPGEFDEAFAKEIIKNIIKSCGCAKIKSADKLLKVFKVPDEFDKYFANETVNIINKEIKSINKKVKSYETDYGFKEIQSENELFETFKSALDKNSFSSDDIKIILRKVKESLNRTMLTKALNVLTENIPEKCLVNEGLLNAVETFLSVHSSFDFDNFKTILMKHIKQENVQKVLEDLRKLKSDKLKIYKAIDRIIEDGIVGVDLKKNKEIKTAIQEIVDNKNFSLSYEHVIKILEQMQINDVVLDFVNTIIFEETTTNNDGNFIETRINNVDCIINAVREYKLDIEDKNPLRDIMRLFFSAGKIDEIGIDSIKEKISEILKEQIYTAVLEKRPALVLLCDAVFLHKKIVLDPNNNIFKQTFLGILGICEDFDCEDEILLDSGNEHIAFYWNSFLSNVNVSNDVSNNENYFYDFILFTIKNIKEFCGGKHALILILMLISKLSPEFLYKKIFPDNKNEDVEQKSPIKDLLELLFQDGKLTRFAENVGKILSDDADVIIDGCEYKIESRYPYYKEYLVCWVVIAHILSNLKCKPEYKDNFLYFFDRFDWKKEKVDAAWYGSFLEDNCNAWLELFDFVDPSFLYGNLDVIERYLTLCKKYSNLIYPAQTKMEQICNYSNYSKYAADPKLNKTDYFYKLLSFSEQCIVYIETEFIFNHLKDEKMKSYYQWIRDNNNSKINDMYKYIKDKKYDDPEQQKKDILLLIEIFPDAMSRYIDVEFLTDNWDDLDSNFKKKCTRDHDGCNHFIDDLAKISDIKKKEEWYVYLLEVSAPEPEYFSFGNVTKIFVDNFSEFSEKAVKTCIDLFKKNNVTENLLPSLFKKVNSWDLQHGVYIKSKPKAEKTLWLIKTFGAEEASKHVDKKFLIKNLNDKDIGDIVKECIKLCVEKDKYSHNPLNKYKFCKLLYDVAVDESVYKNIEQPENKQAQKKKIILDLIDICKEKIFEHVDNSFLLENLDNEMIKNIFGYASESKITSVLVTINSGNYDDDKKKELYVKWIRLIKCNPNISTQTMYDNIKANRCLSEEGKKIIYSEFVKCRPDVISEYNWFRYDENIVLEAATRLILEKDISFLSFLNNSILERYSIRNLFDYISKQSPEKITQIIKAMSCLDSSSLKTPYEYKYMFRNLACIKYNLDNNDSFSSLPFENVTLASNLFKIHNQPDCDFNLVDLVSEKHRLCCKTIDSYLPEYKNLSRIIKSSYKKYLWFIGISFFIFLAIFISCFWVGILVTYFVPHISLILLCLLTLDWLNVIRNERFTVFKKIFLPWNLTEYETKIKHEKEARHSFYSFLNDKFNFKNHVVIYDEVIKVIKEKNIDIKKDFFDWLETNEKEEAFDKENNREKKIDFVVAFIFSTPNNEIIKKLDGEIGKLGDFSNDNKARNLINNWLNENPNYNDCGGVLQSEFLDMIKFKSDELKIKLKRKDNIKVLAEKIYDQIIEPQDKKMLIEIKNNKEEEIDTSEKNVIINNNNSQSVNINLIPLLDISNKNQI